MISCRYCHECMNKATGERNCLVCGKRTGKNLVLCELCPRAYHTDCHNPVMPKVSATERISTVWDVSRYRGRELIRFPLIQSVSYRARLRLQMPRGKWYCSNCHSKQPKKRNSSRRSHTKGGGTRESENSDHPPAR